MTDTKAPERIWIQDPDGCGAVSFCDKQVNADDQKYIRADLCNELMRAAERLLSRPVSPSTGGRMILEVDLQYLEQALAKTRGDHSSSG